LPPRSPDAYPPLSPFERFNDAIPSPIPPPHTTDELEEGEIREAFQEISNATYVEFEHTNKASLQKESQAPCTVDDAMAFEMDSLILEEDEQSRYALLSPIKKTFKQQASTSPFFSRLDKAPFRGSLSALQSTCHNFEKIDSEIELNEFEDEKKTLFSSPNVQLKSERSRRSLTPKKSDITGIPLSTAEQYKFEPLEISPILSQKSPILTKNSSPPTFASEHMSLPSLSPRSSGSTKEQTLKSGEFESEAVAHMKDLHKKQILELKNEQAITESQLLAAMNEKSKFIGILSEYEATMTAMISDADAYKQEFQESLRKLQDEKGNMEVELQAVEVAFKDLKSRHDDMLIINEGLKRSEQLLNENLAQSKEIIAAYEKRYDALKVHAEQKLAAANEEVIKSKTNYEKETALMKSKVIKMEHQIKSLENALECKTKENAELMTICDELIQKIDAK
jgi:hypothetical protein